MSRPFCRVRSSRRAVLAVASTLAACGDPESGRVPGASDAGADAALDGSRGDASPDARVKDAAPVDASPAHDAPPTPDGAGGGDGDDAPDSGREGFAPFDGLEDGRARRVGDSFYIAPQALVSVGDGTGWLLTRSYPDPNFSSETIGLDRFDASGAFVERSPLAATNPDGLALHPDGSLTVLKNRCGPATLDTCFLREGPAGDVVETLWPASPRNVTRHQLDADGNVTGTFDTVIGERHVPSIASAVDGGLFALSLQGGYEVHRFDGALEPEWSVELLPSVVPPDLPLDAPIEELLRAAELAQQFATEPVAVDGGVVIAATVNRGTLGVLAQRGAGVQVPDDPRCPDVVVIRIDGAGGGAQYTSVPTPECERLPKLTVVGHHAVVATTVAVARPPEPNDTHQYDTGLAIVNLTNGHVVSRTLALEEEDDRVHALAPCGADRVCLAGMTGARSVDTGSVVTMGKGFVLPVSLEGEAGSPRYLTSARHSEVLHLVAAGPGSVVFFGTVDGPITHTADADPWLGYNKGLLGRIDGL